jgi:hypothetical protein
MGDVPGVAAAEAVLKPLIEEFATRPRAQESQSLWRSRAQRRRRIRGSPPDYDTTQHVDARKEPGAVAKPSAAHISFTFTILGKFSASLFFN